MRYIGSKRRIAKEILEIMLKDRKENQWYIEPFVGGANPIKHCPPPCIGYDNNEYLIELHKKIQENWMPKEVITEEKYNDIKKNKNLYPKELVAFCGVYLSFGSKWLGCFSRNTDGKNHYLSALNDLKKMHIETKHVLFRYIDTYQNIVFPESSIIYCDPPYQKTKKTKFYTENDFNFDNLKEWMIKKNNEGHKVFFSEYEEFNETWCKEVFNKKVRLQLNNNNGERDRFRVERLYEVVSL